MRDKSKIIIRDLYQELFDVEQPGKFFHYTTLSAIYKIMEGKSLRLSHNTNLNDLNDNNPSNFILCFTTSSVESIPLWYLYTGVNADGVRLELTKKGIEKIIKKKIYYYKNGIKCFITSDNLNISFKPILYYEEEKTTDKGYEQYYRIKFNHNVYYTTKKCIENFKRDYSSFCKTMEWNYEKETRLNIKIINYNIVDIEALYFDLYDLEKHISITFGPNYKRDVNIENKLLEFISKNKIFTSRLKNKLNINMCRECKMCKECKKKDIHI